MNYKKHHIQKRKKNKERLYHWKNSAKFKSYYGGELFCKIKLRKLVNCS